jgi:hypothetical protein
MSDEDIQHCEDMAELGLSDEELTKLSHEQVEAGNRAGRAIVRKLLRERRGYRVEEDGTRTAEDAPAPPF